MNESVVLKEKKPTIESMGSVLCIPPLTYGVLKTGMRHLELRRLLLERKTAWRLAFDLEFYFYQILFFFFFFREEMLEHCSMMLPGMASGLVEKSA